MGDRGNIVIVYHDDNEAKQIYFYTHWKGYNLPEIVHRAIKRRERWDDIDYLARIIFCEMIKGDESGSTGFGIAPYPMDNEYRFIYVDNGHIKVDKTFYSDCIYENDDLRKEYVIWTFEEFASMEYMNWYIILSGPKEYNYEKDQSNQLTDNP